MLSPTAAASASLASGAAGRWSPRPAPAAPLRAAPPLRAARPQRHRYCHNPSGHSTVATWAGASDAAERDAGTVAAASAASSSGIGTRRGVVLGLLAGVLSTGASTSAAAKTMPESLGEDEVGLVNGRLRKCAGSFNCVSTSSSGGAPEQYATPWTAATTDVPAAVAQVTAAVLRACPDARLLQSYEAPAAAGHYLRFAMPGKLGVDNVEFLIANEGVGDRGWVGPGGY